MEIVFYNYSEFFNKIVFLALIRIMKIEGITYLMLY